MLSWLIDLERRRLVNLSEPSSVVHGDTRGIFTQNLAVMSEIPLDLEDSDQEGKLYSAESLNNLHKMIICSDSRDLLSAPPPTSPNGSPQRLEKAVSDARAAPPTSSSEIELTAAADSARQRVEGIPCRTWNSGILDSLLHLLRPDAPMGNEDEERRSSRSVCQAPIRRVTLLLTAMLLTGLVLSFCAIYLIVRNSAVLGELAGNAAEGRYLEELRRWKALLEKDPDNSISEETAK